VPLLWVGELPQLGIVFDVPTARCGVSGNSGSNEPDDGLRPNTQVSVWSDVSRAKACVGRPDAGAMNLRPYMANAQELRREADALLVTFLFLLAREEVGYVLFHELWDEAELGEQLGVVIAIGKLFRGSVALHCHV